MLCFLHLTGADVNLKNSGGRTALHYAASKGWLKIAEILISQGAKINLKDKACNFTLENFYLIRNNSIFHILPSSCAHYV